MSRRPVDTGDDGRARPDFVRRLAGFRRRLPLFNRLDAHMKDVVRKGSLVLLLRMVAKGFGFMTSVLIARLFDAEGIGIYYLALTLTTVGTLLGRMGLDNTMLRFIAAGVDKQEWQEARGVYRQGMLIAAFISTIVAAAVFLAAPLFALHLFSEPALTQVLRLMSLGILPASLAILHAQALKAIARPVLATLVEAAGVSLLYFALIFPLAKTFGLPGIAIGYAVTHFTLLAVARYFWWRFTPRAGPVTVTRQGLDVLVRTSWPLLLVASMSWVMGWTDTFMLGMWTSSESVGIYGVSMRTAGLTSFVLIAVNSVLAPKFAALYGRGDVRGLESLAQNGARLTAALALPLLLAFAAFPALILSAFGTDFRSGAPVLVILAVGQFLNAATGSVGYLLMMTGREKLMRNNILGAALANVVLNAILIQSFGIVGAAVATAVTLAGMNVVSAILVYRELSILTLPIPGLRGVR